MKIIYNLAFLVLLQFSFACNESFEFKASSPVMDSKLKQKNDKAGVANIVFKSTDGGQTWQDISEGLPEPVNVEYGSGRNGFFADNNGLWLTAGNGIYHSKPNSKRPFWKNEIFPDEHCSISPGKAVVRLGKQLTSR